MTDDFDNVLSEGLKASSLIRCDERVFRGNDALRAVAEASRNGIAVLGVEVFRVLPDALQSVPYFCTYRIFFTGDWNDFVEANNREATKFFADHCEDEHPDESYGYVLTATSEREFRALKNA